jgi:hypothetical protein
MAEEAHGYWLAGQAIFSPKSEPGVFNSARLEYHPPLKQELASAAGHRFAQQIRLRAARVATSKAAAIHSEGEDSCFRFGYTGEAARV